MGKQNWLILAVLILAAFLRFWQLGQNPPSLNWDEAAWGYNAYSLGIDGRDEFGKFLPLQYFESFGDFKPPVYAYLDVLPVKFFGLNEFAVRFPSALLGLFTVLITYFLVKRIFKWSANVNRYALLSAFFLAISPWHINLSRAAFEANVATFFLVSGVWLFLVGIQDKKFYLPFSIFPFALAMYTFNTSRIVAPLLGIMLILGCRREILKIKKQLIGAVILGAIVFLPLAQFFLSPQSKLRFHEVNIFSDIGVIKRINEEIANDQNAAWSKILHNRRFAFSVEFVKHYLDNFNPAFLFTKGDGNPKFSTQDVGQLYLWDLPFLVFGILLLFRKRPGFWWLIPAWLLIAVIPAGTARETPHALRVEATLPTWQILVAVGFVGFWDWFKKIEFQRFLKISVHSFLFAFLIFNFIYYFHGYLFHYPREFSGEWQYGYKEAIAYAQGTQGSYNKVLFTEKLGRPYIYLLFYTKADPARFRQEAKIWREVLGFVHVDGYGKYQFSKDVGTLAIPGEKMLIIDTPGSIPNNAQILKTFNLLNGEPALVAYTF